MPRQLLDGLAGNRGQKRLPKELQERWRGRHKLELEREVIDGANGQSIGRFRASYDVFAS